jgi:ribosomal protein S18 acetylase RimI-like enzyme
VDCFRIVGFILRLKPQVFSSLLYKFVPRRVLPVASDFKRCRPRTRRMVDALHIRPAAPADTGRVRAVYERAMRDADAFLPAADHSDLEDPTEAYADGAFLVGEVDGAVVVVGGLRPVEPDDGPPTVEMKRVAVLPAHQGQGHGRGIVRALETAARERGAERIVLETGEDQHAAQGLYESLGYEQTERVSYAGGAIVGLRYATRL